MFQPSSRLAPRPHPARAAAALVCALAALVTSYPARASITPDARDVVERYLEVTGGRAAYEAIQSARVVSNVRALGMQGTIVTLQRAPDRFATDTHLGSLNLKSGFDGTKAWRIGPDGKLVVLDGIDLDDARASAWFANDRWLDADQGGGTVRLHGYEREADAAFTVLEVVPPVGKPRQYWFDQKTGLIDRVTERDDQRIVTTFNSDYREAGGRKWPFKSHSKISGMPANDIHAEIDSVAFGMELPDDAFAAPVETAAPALTWLKTPGVARIPFEYRMRHVWLRVSVNGAPPADFLYDTGASITVLDSAYVASLGIATEGHMQAAGAGAAGGASFAKVATLRVASADGDGIELSDRTVAVLSVNPHLAPFFWRDCAGIIGYDVLTQFVNQIDFDAATLTLRDPKTYQHEGGGAAIPFRLAGTVPVIPIKIDGTYEGEVRLDVGSSSSIDLHSPFVRRHDLLAKASKAGKSIEVTGGGFGGTFTSTLTRMKKLEVGPYAWDDPLIVLSGATEGALASEDYAGNAGNQVLERFKCTFDYERRLLYLEPGKRFGQRDRFSLAGVQLVRMEGAVEAMEVIPGSAAAKAGIREGDRVAAIDGRPIAELNTEDLRRLFEDGEVGRKIPIELTRDGKKKKATLKLAEIL